MTNVLIIPTSGLMEFNASAAAGGFSGTLDNSYANAVRLDIANSATLKITGKNATDNRRVHVSGTNGDLLLVRDINVTSTGSATMETPSVSSTKVSGVSAFFDTVSATNFVGNLGTGQFVDVSGDTMSGTLTLSSSPAATGTVMLSSNASFFASGNISAVGDVSSAASVRGVSGLFSNTVQATTVSGGTLTVTGNASVTGTVSSTGNQLSLGEMSSAGAHRGTSGIFTTTVQAPTLSGTSAIVSSLSALSAVSAASISSAGDIRGVSAIISNTVQAPTLSGGTLSVTGNASVTGTVSSTGNQLSLGEMSSAGAHRGSSGIFTTTLQAPTLSGTSAIVSSLSALSAVSAASISSAGDIRGVSAIISNTVQAPTISATNISATGNVSSAAFSGVSAFVANISSTNISATTNVSSAAFSGLSAFVGTISSTNLSATAGVSAASGRFPALSGTTIGATTIIPGAAAGVAPTDLIISAGAGELKVSGNTALSLSSGGAISLNATAVNVTNGTLSVTGHFAATSKAFVIDHPTPEKKAQGMKLQYACLEGPENGVYVRGKEDTKVGVIVLPDYWMDLVHADSITVQLTAMSPAQRLYVSKIEDNKVYVKDASAVSEVTTFFYTVNGERKDIDHLTIEY